MEKKWKLAIFAVSLHIFRFFFFFTEMFLEYSSTIHMNLSKWLNLIGCHDNIKGKFSKKYLKINSSEAVWGIKLKLCKIVSNNSLYKMIVFSIAVFSSTLVAVAT